MTNIRSIILGSLIALITSLITSIVQNHFMFKKIKLQEKENNKRATAELNSRIDLENKAFEHKIVLNNREYIPQATKAILVAINHLFNCTQDLVFNYPGVFFISDHPSESNHLSEMFDNLQINNLTVGFPSSLEEVNELNKNWRNAKNELNNVLNENLIFFSDEIFESVQQYIKKCRGINTYFGGYYLGLNNEMFLLKMQEYENISTDVFTRNPKGIGEQAHQVLNDYKELEQFKIGLLNQINCYQKQKTEL